MGEPFKLKNGSILVSTEAPGGLYNAAQLKKIAALCESDAAVAKATEDQRLALFIKPDKATMVVKELRAVGLGVRHYQDGVHQPVSCVGQLCSEFKQDALASAMDLSENLRGVATKSSLKIGINGCAKCCVPTHTLDVSAIGDESGYRISIGGKTSQIPELASFLAEAVPASELSARISNLAKAFSEHGQPGESLQEMIERCGASQFVQIFAPYSQDAAGGGDSFDLGTGDEIAGTDLGADAAPSEDLAISEAEVEPDGGMDSGDSEQLSAADSDAEMGELADISPSSNVDGAVDDISLDISPGQDTSSGDLKLDDEISLNAGAEPVEDADFSLESDADAGLVESGAVAAEETADLDFGDEDLALGSDQGASTDPLPDAELNLDESDAGMLSAEEEVATANLEAAQSEPEDLKLDIADESMPDLDLDTDDATVDASADAGLDDISLENAEPEIAAAGEVDLEAVEPELTVDDDINLTAVEPELVSDAKVSAPEDDIELSLDDEDPALSAESQETAEEQAESRLEESIEVEATIDESAEVDENADERAEALRLVSEQESEQDVAAKPAVNPNLIPEDDLDLEIDEAPDFGEIAADLNATSGSAAQARSNISAAPQARSSSGSGFQGANVDPRGVVVLSFGTGMTIELNSSELAQGSQDLQLGGQAVRIEKSKDTVSVSVNGIRLNLPVKKAA